MLASFIPRCAYLKHSGKSKLTCGLALIVALSLNKILLFETHLFFSGSFYENFSVENL
jgi:hypothetical protein